MEPFSFLSDGVSVPPLHQRLEGSHANGILSVEGVGKVYGSRTVLRDLTFDVVPGTVTAIVGTNGAGKTTIMSILSGQLPVDRGRISRAGKTMRSSDLASITALIPESPAMYPTLTPREHLRFIALGRKLDASSGDRSEELARRFNLTEYMDQPAASLSKGNQQKTLIACALLADTPIVLLDEPFIGLDPPAQAELLVLISELRTLGRAIVLTTHVLEFAVRSSDVVIALSDGAARFVDAALPDAIERLRAVFSL
jgi:ABC-2 type transport system ATP-binding protein